jgi:hypothetical protein
VYETDDLERELRDGLRLREAPAGFADRVVARAAAQGVVIARKSPSAWTGLLREPIVRWAVAASLLIAVAAGGYARHEQERRAAGERARQQVFLALRITSSALQAVHNKIVTEDE